MPGASSRFPWARVPSTYPVAAITAVGAAVGLAHPIEATAISAANAVLSGAFVALCAVAASKARRWTWAVLSGAAAALADPLALQLLAVAALAVSLWAIRQRRRSGALGAAIGATSGIALLWGSALSSAATAAILGIAIVCLTASVIKQTRGSQRRAISLALVGFAGVSLVVMGAYGVAALSAKNNADSGIRHLRAGLDAARANDANKATSELKVAARNLASANDSLDKPWAKPIRVLPGIGRNAEAIDEMAATAADLAAVSARAASSVDLSRIEIKGGQLDLDVVAQVDTATTEVAQALDHALVRLQAVDSGWLVGPVSSRLDEAVSIIRDAQPSLRNVHDAVSVAPTVLGQAGVKRYLVLFVTPVEARGSVGFPGNFAEIEADNGRIRMTRFGRTTQDLQTQGLPLADRAITGPPDYLLRYSRFAPAQTWHNVTMSPDFPSVAQVVAELYPQSGGKHLDGVVAMDPTALAALLELTGPVQVTGLAQAISSQNAVQFLQEQQYVDFLKQPGDIDVPNAQRIDMLESVAKATFDKLTNGNLPAAKRTADVLAPVVTDGHLRFVSFDESVAAVLKRTRIDGALAPIEGDNLAVIVNNAGGNKIDAFLHRTTNYDVVWDSTTGDISGTLILKLQNDAPSTGLPDYIIGNSLKALPNGKAIPPKGTNRLWLSIYTPWRPDSTTIDGASTNLQLERELSRWVASTMIDVPPAQSVTIVVKWRGRLQPATTYQLDVVHQPQATVEDLKVRVTNAEGDRVAANTGLVEGAVASLSGPITHDQRVIVTTR
jgi:hypothetical protein